MAADTNQLSLTAITLILAKQLAAEAASKGAPAPPDTIQQAVALINQQHPQIMALFGIRRL